MTRSRAAALAVLAVLVGVLGSAVGYRVGLPGEEVIWCCDGDGCAPVQFISDCPDGGEVFYCEWGQSAEQSNDDGSSGWVCLE